MPSELLPPPDFPAGLFSLNRLPELLQIRGAVLLRGMLPANLMQHWLPAFEEAYQAADRLFESGQMDSDTWRNFFQFGHVDPREVKDYAQWLQQLLKQPGLRNLLRAALGPQSLVFVNYSMPRRQTSVRPEQAIGFHQDQEFIGPLQRAINLWMPLTPAGGLWPGLELWLDGPPQPLLNFVMKPAEREQICARIPPEALWRPEMRPGDVLIFSHYTVHRTWLTDAMEQTRFSYELRVISQADKGRAQPPLLPCDI